MRILSIGNIGVINATADAGERERILGNNWSAGAKFLISPKVCLQIACSSTEIWTFEIRV